jgi:hypothetical protein
MDPDTDIETRLYDQRRRSSRAPWDPPPRPAKPSTIRRRAGDRRLEDVFSGSDDDMVRGAD